MDGALDLGHRIGKLRKASPGKRRVAHHPHHLVLAGQRVVADQDVPLGRAMARVEEASGRPQLGAEVQARGEAIAQHVGDVSLVEHVPHLHHRPLVPQRSLRRERHVELWTWLRRREPGSRSESEEEEQAPARHALEPRPEPHEDVDRLRPVRQRLGDVDADVVEHESETDVGTKAREGRERPLAV